MTPRWGQLHRNLRLTAALSFAYQLAALVSLPWHLSPADPEEICCSPWWCHRCLRTRHPDLPVAAGRNKEAVGGCWEVSGVTWFVDFGEQSRTLTPPGAHHSWEDCPSGMFARTLKFYKLGYFHYLQWKAKLGFYPKSAANYHFSSLSFPICHKRMESWISFQL